MTRFNDFHSHADWVDGKDTAREMTDYAIKKGLMHFGISEHLYCAATDCGIKGESLDAYLSEVTQLKETFQGKIDLLCGVEVEDSENAFILTECQKNQIDYYIRSTHCLTKNGISFDVDNTPQILSSMVETLYDGNWYSLISHFFSVSSRVSPLLNYSFIGHFDLITKFNQDDILFSTSSDEYIQPALEAMDALLETGLPFEVNTGAISRGYRKEPYPSSFLLKELFQRNGKIIINSDAHFKEAICYKYKEALKLAYSCGFRNIYILTSSGIQKQEL